MNNSTKRRHSFRTILRFVKRHVDTLFLYTILAITRWYFQTKRTKTILIVRTDGIGDFLYFSRYLRLISEQFPNHSLVLCCRNEILDSARIMPYLTDVYGVDLRKYNYNYIYRFAVILRLRLFMPEIALYASYHRVSTGDEMILLSGAKETFAFSSNDECIHHSIRLRNNRKFTHLIDVPDRICESDKYKTLLEGLKIFQEPHVEDITVLKSALHSSSALTSDTIIKRSGYIVIAPGTHVAMRRWPPNNFARLADTLIDIYGKEVLFCGGREERPLCETIVNSMHHSAEYFTEISLLRTVYLIENADCFIGNDSGLLHVAAVLNTPAVGILGGGHFKRYFPYGTMQIANHYLECYHCNWDCKYPEPYCITQITVEDVIEKVKVLINGRYQEGQRPR